MIEILAQMVGGNTGWGSGEKAYLSREHLDCELQKELIVEVETGLGTGLRSPGDTKALRHQPAETTR